MKLLLYILFSAGLLINSAADTQERIRVTGIATNAKAGAVVLDDTGTPYYVDGLDHWEEQYLDKLVTVTGELKKVKIKDENKGAKKKKQQSKGTQLVLVNPEWEPAKK
ncbi:hypothetical protein OGH69_17230 [Flavobacterium sp. MFBS3-15]|uniref:hypothetical protein n=1 Tax=Flavobacterium sp. MFBS3-15 TaxID=2989816 RepID=UPI002235CB26|nr:hypothetical protein [Flavobacterium sp. MFBS3-15]MCW4470718.1 hypothetical protein [Flavobacterium sp. MFBS3-15]